jgi:hypothetical protein
MTGSGPTPPAFNRRALAELVDAVPAPLEPAEAIPRTGFDPYLSVDDDTEHRLPPDRRPRAYWAINTHRDFPARLRRSPGSDLVDGCQVPSLSGRSGQSAWESRPAISRSEPRLTTGDQSSPMIGPARRRGRGRLQGRTACGRPWRSSQRPSFLRNLVFFGATPSSHGR